MKNYITKLVLTTTHNYPKPFIPIPTAVHLVSVNELNTASGNTYNRPNRVALIVLNDKT